MKKYYLPDQGETVEDSREIPDSNNLDADLCAEIAAELIHRNRDGWEWEWPITIAIVEDNTEVCRFLVDREFRPNFYATML